MIWGAGAACALLRAADIPRKITCAGEPSMTTDLMGFRMAAKTGVQQRKAKEGDNV